MKIVQAKYLVSLTIFLFGIVAATAAKDTVAIIDAGSSGSRLYIFEVDNKLICSIGITKLVRLAWFMVMPNAVCLPDQTRLSCLEQ